MSIAGNVFCAHAFKFFRCQAICIATVELIKDGCYWCCSTKSPYEKCVKPFEDIIGRMGQGCDPGGIKMKKGDIVFWVLAALLLVYYVYKRDWITPLIFVSTYLILEHFKAE